MATFSSPKDGSSVFSKMSQQTNKQWIET